MFNGKDILKRLNQDCNDSWIRVTDYDTNTSTYVPIHTYLFDFKLIRKTFQTWKDKKMTIEEYKNKPVVLTVDKVELPVIEILIDLIAGEKIDSRLYQSNDIQALFVIILDRIGSTEEISSLVSRVHIKSTAWRIVAESNIEISNILDLDRRLEICKDLPLPKIEAETFYILCGFITYLSEDYSKILKDTRDRNNWRYKVYRHKDKKAYCFDFVNERHAFVILYSPIDYSIEEKCSEVVSQNQYNFREQSYDTRYQCEIIKESVVTINTEKEKVLYIRDFTPYICGYRCKSVWYHGHGN